MTLRIAVISDLFNAGLTEDGRRYDAERYCIMAEDENGSRWVHPQYFNSTEVEYTEEDGFPYFPDMREEAQAKAEVIASETRQFIRSGGKVDLDSWLPTDPAYGSGAYQTLESSGYLKQREIKEAFSY